MERCVDGSCYFSQSTTVALPVAPLSTACLEFISPDGLSPPTVVNITMARAFYTYVSDYVYYSDDPSVHSKGFCGCPGGTTVSCSDCPVSVSNSDVSTCTGGVHNDDSCFEEWFGGSGAYCFQTGFTGRNRYKIAKYKDTITKDFLLQFNFGNDSWAIDYAGYPIEYSTETSDFNVTVISDTTVPPIRPEFTVIDLNSPQDFYLLGDDEVNSINDFDYRKLGWYKTNSTTHIDSAIGNQITVSVKNCEDDKFTVTYPWISQAAFLSTKRDKLSKNLIPGSRYIDSEISALYQSSQQIPQHQSGHFFEAMSGFIALGGGADIAAVGAAIDLDGITHVYPPLVYTGVTAASVYKKFDACSLMSDHACNYNYTSVSSNLTASRVLVLVDPVQSDDLYMTILKTSEGHNLFCAGYTTPYNCGNQTFHIQIYPTGDIAQIRYDGLFHIKLLTDNLGADTEIMLPTDKGVIEISIEFQNLEVQYDDTSVKPKILSAKQDDDTITVTAQSISVAGTCYISTYPAGRIITQTIDLTMAPNDYDYNIGASITGNLLILIQCYRYNSTYTLKVDYVSDEDVQAQNTTDVDSDNNDADWWDVVDPSNWWDSVKDLFGFNSLLSFKWWHYLVILGEIILGLIVAYILIRYVIWNGLKFVIRKVKMQRKYSSMKKDDDYDSDEIVPQSAPTSFYRRRPYRG
jgi:membrane-bound inhibitor of C-type lysozyme